MSSGENIPTVEQEGEGAKDVMADTATATDQDHFMQGAFLNLLGRRDACRAGDVEVYKDNDKTVARIPGAEEDVRVPVASSAFLTWASEVPGGLRGVRIVINDTRDGAVDAINMPPFEVGNGPRDHKVVTGLARRKPDGDFTHVERPEPESSMGYKELEDRFADFGGTERFGKAADHFSGIVIKALEELLASNVTPSEFAGLQNGQSRTLCSFDDSEFANLGIGVPPEVVYNEKALVNGTLKSGINSAQDAADRERRRAFAYLIVLVDRRVGIFLQKNSDKFKLFYQGTGQSCSSGDGFKYDSDVDEATYFVCNYNIKGGEVIVCLMKRELRNSRGDCSTALPEAGSSRELEEGYVGDIFYNSKR